MRVKKVISSFLVVVMLLSMLPTSAFAASGISDESANVDVQDSIAYFQYPDNDSEYVYTIIPTNSLDVYGVADADELVSIINGKWGDTPADLSDAKYDFDAGASDPDVVNGNLDFELYVSNADAGVFKESDNMPIYTSGVLIFYRLDSNFITADGAAYGFPTEAPTAYIYSITGLYAEKVEVAGLGGYTFSLDIDDSGLTNATVEADAYSDLELGDSVEVTITPDVGFEFTTEPSVEVFGGDASSLTENSGVYTFTISNIYDEVYVIVEGEAVVAGSGGSTNSVYSISLNTTLLLNAIVELSKDTNIEENDVVTLTITPNTGYAFDVAPVVDVDGATAGSVIDNDDFYTCEITDFTEDAVITVSGEAKDLVLANGPVAIDYVDPNETDIVWDGSSNITISSEADIYILEAYNHNATMIISADVDIIGYGYLTTVTNKKSAFVINNGANVTIDNVRIEREVEPGAQTENLFYIDAASVEANDIDIYEATRGVFELVNDAELVVTGEDTTIESRIGTDGRPIFDNKDGSVTVYDGFFSRGADTNNSGQVVGNDTESTFTMYGGTIVNYYGSTDTIANGNIYIYGGSISGGENAAAIRTGKLTDIVVIENCTIYNSKIAVKVGKDNSGGNVTIGGDVIFEDNETDIYLSTVNSVVTLEDDFTGRASVDTAVNTFPVRITHNGTDEKLRDQVYPVDSNSAVNFNYTDGYLYLWNHNHTWNYIEDANEPNKIFAQCEDTDCTYNDSIFIQLVGIDGIACDYEYDCMYLIDNLSGIIPEFTITPKYYRILDDGNVQELIEQPVAMGDYLVEIELGGATAMVEFIIDHTWASDCDEVCENCPYDRGFNAIHNFSDEIRSADTLISGADCENDAVYYLTCADCGAISDDMTMSFIDIGSHFGHTYDETVWVTDDTHHWYASTCVHTDAKKNNEEHIASEWITDIVAQIGVKGSKHKECTICAKVLETAEIPAKSSGNSVSYYSVNKESTENGSFTVNRNSAYSGANIVITVIPDKDYEVKFVEVKDTKGNIIEVSKNTDGTYSFKMPSRSVTVSIEFNEIIVKGSYANCKNDFTCPMHNFADIDTNKWYHDGIHYCLDNGIMVGYGNGEFKPYATTSRAMVAVMLWRLEGSPLVPLTEGFNDVFDTDWYNDAVRWMSANNIAGGYGENIWGPNDAITREQLVSILYRYAQHKGIDVSVGENTNILSYNDAFEVSEWAIPAMQWACGTGIVVGNENKLMPSTEASRAQMSTIFQRFCVNILKIK